MKLNLKILIVFLGMLGATACVDSPDPIWYFFDEPAILTYNNQDAVLITSFGNYKASELNPDKLDSGQCLLSNFIVDYSVGEDIASSIMYNEVQNSSIQIGKGGMVDDFTDSISSAQLFVHYVGTNIFFSFEQYKEQENNLYRYELICNEDSVKDGVAGESIYGLYLRVKPVSSEGAEKINGKRYYAFDVKKFSDKYKDKNGQVTVNIFYKNTTQQGKDRYKSFKDNPITLSFPDSNSN